MLAERERSMCSISRTYFRGGIAVGNVGALEGTTKNNKLINPLPRTALVLRGPRKIFDFWGALECC